MLQTCQRKEHLPNIADTRWDLQIVKLQVAAIGKTRVWRRLLVSNSSCQSQLSQLIILWNRSFIWSLYIYMYTYIYIFLPFELTSPRIRYRNVYWAHTTNIVRENLKILIALGCQGCHTLGDLNNIYLLTFPESTSPRSKCRQVWLLLRPLPLIYREPTSCCDLVWPFFCVHTERTSSSVSSCSYKDRNPVLLD